MRFDSYHPMINLIYFAAVIAGTIGFTHPVLLCLSFLSGFIYSIKLNGKKAFFRNLCFTAFAAGYMVWYAFYHHFGVTVLWKNFIGNSVTLEAVCCGLEKGMTAAAVMIWSQCVFEIMTADKAVYLFGRISPRLSLFVSVLLRSMPRTAVRAERIERSREGIGKGIVRGNLFSGFLNLCFLISGLITWTMEDFVESANSMKSRGYSLKGRTAFSIYRFDNRDRMLVIVIALCLTVLGAAQILGQTKILFDPVIVLPEFTPWMAGICVVDAFFLLLPLILQIYGEHRFKNTMKI